MHRVAAKVHLTVSSSVRGFDDVVVECVYPARGSSVWSPPAAAAPPAVVARDAVPSNCISLQMVREESD